MRNTDLIPSTFYCGGQKMEVRHVERLDDGNVGSTYWCGGFIEIADQMKDGTKISEGSKTNTFYHELVHTILDNMGEAELTENERFVTTFAGFLTEAMTTADYPEIEFRKMLYEMQKAENLKMSSIAK